MASIGGVTCDYLYGDIPTLKQLVEIYHRPGMNGVGVRKMGTGEGSFQLRAVNFDTSTGATTTWVGQIEALVGTIVSVVDNWGDTKTNCLIESVTPPEKQAVLAGASDVSMGVLTISGRVVS